MVEFPPDVAVFAAVRDMTGRWSVLAPVNHHPGGGVGVRCVAVIGKRDCRFSLEPLPRSLGAKRRAIRGARDRRGRRSARFDRGATGGSIHVLGPVRQF
jgi:hypothetical protein